MVFLTKLHSELSCNPFVFNNSFTLCIFKLCNLFRIYNNLELMKVIDGSGKEKK